MTKSKTASYQKQPKNHTALTQLGNWLKSVGVVAKPSSTTGCDLLVKTRTGEEVEIKVGVTVEDARPAVEHLFVLAKELTHRNKKVALRAFHGITEAVGYGTPKPINRGAELDKKASFEESFELVAMRHAEFRKVPNPSAADYATYDKVIGKAVSRFLYINTKICRRHGLDAGDLKTYAQIWTANYLGLYKVANPTNNDNERKLYAHLCQRFGNFVEVLLKKERSCIPESEVASVALFGIPWAGRGGGQGARTFEREALEADAQEAFEAEIESQPSDFEELDGLMTDVQEFTAVDEEEREQKVSDALRRAQAQEALAAEFGKLTHDRLLEVLSEAAGNQALCYDARQEAKKQLRLHRQGCASCLKAQEEAAAADAGR